MSNKDIDFTTDGIIPITRNRVREEKEYKPDDIHVNVEMSDEDKISFARMIDNMSDYTIKDETIDKIFAHSESFEKMYTNKDAMENVVFPVNCSVTEIDKIKKTIHSEYSWGNHGYFINLTNYKCDCCGAPFRETFDIEYVIIDGGLLCKDCVHWMREGNNDIFEGLDNTEDLFK